MLRRCTNFLFLQHYSCTAQNIRKYCSDSLDTSIKLASMKRNLRYRKNESLDQQKARLLYQSRKRGMLENDLLLSTFADKYLDSLNPELLNQYDKLINEPLNDWDIYYWLTGKEEPPPQFINEIFYMLKKHTENKSREKRYMQPNLYS